MHNIPEVPTLRGTTASNNDLATLFKYSICFDYALPPIFQCHSGHLVCSNWHPKFTCCPTCQGPLGSIHNLALEKLATSVLFPCKYAPYGCETSHEVLCEFRPCPYPSLGTFCKWQRTLDTVIPHLKNQHPFVATLKGEDIIFPATDINLSRALDWVMIQSC